MQVRHPPQESLALMPELTSLRLIDVSQHCVRNLFFLFPIPVTDIGIHILCYVASGAEVDGVLVGLPKALVSVDDSLE